MSEITEETVTGPGDWRGVTLVTGTDTDVGKTVATAVLTAALRQAGCRIAVVKPAQTGLAPGEEGADADQVVRLAGLQGAAVHEYVRLPEPLAPTTAARRAGVELPGVTEHARRLAQLAERHDAVVVEGAGGLLVGLDSAGRGLLELADALRCTRVPTRFLVVTRAGLGTLNHSALTCRAIRSRGHDLAGLVIGSLPAAEELARPEHLAIRCNVQELPDVCSAPLLFAVPAGIGDDPDRVQQTARQVPLHHPAPPSWELLTGAGVSA